MKSNYIHVCFIIDESGSMSSSTSDVIGGFNKMIKEQKEETNGECSISLYKFNNNVKEVYIGKNVHDVEFLRENITTVNTGIRTLLTNFTNKLFNNGHDADNVTLNNVNAADVQIKDVQDINVCFDNNEANTYCPGGCTAMNDGIGTAIDNIGKWLSAMPEEERPEKNLIVIMTDGQENCSSIYTLEKVRNMIKHQEEVYSWTFMYMGTDITNTDDADALGIQLHAYNTRADLGDSYKMISSSAKLYRNMSYDMDATTKNACLCASLADEVTVANTKYKNATGIEIK